MSEVTQPDSIGSMKLYDTLSFETAHGIVDVLRVAPGWGLCLVRHSYHRDGAVEPLHGPSRGTRAVYQVNAWPHE
jgi:hypothetical protein